MNRVQRMIYFLLLAGLAACSGADKITSSQPQPTHNISIEYYAAHPDTSGAWSAMALTDSGQAPTSIDQIDFVSEQPHKIYLQGRSASPCFVTWLWGAGSNVDISTEMNSDSVGYRLGAKRLVVYLIGYDVDSAGYAINQKEMMIPLDAPIAGNNVNGRVRIPYDRTYYSGSVATCRAATPNRYNTWQMTRATPIVRKYDGWYSRSDTTTTTPTNLIFRDEPQFDRLHADMLPATPATNFIRQRVQSNIRAEAAAIFNKRRNRG
jgi:hypothetical protein